MVNDSVLVPFRHIFQHSFIFRRLCPVNDCVRIICCHNGIGCVHIAVQLQIFTGRKNVPHSRPDTIIHDHRAFRVFILRFIQILFHGFQTVDFRKPPFLTQVFPVHETFPCRHTVCRFSKLGDSVQLTADLTAFQCFIGYHRVMGHQIRHFTE